MNKKNNKGKLFQLQFLISIAFTIIAVIGIVFVGGSLYIPFYNSALDMLANDHKQVIEQVNLNLDGYLRSMMRISDSVYFKVIKNKNFQEQSISNELSLLYDTNIDRLVSIALFSDEGEIVSATPLSNVKKYIDVKEQDWFITAKGKIENFHFSDPHVQNIFDDLDLRYPWVVSLSRSVDITYDGKIKYGVLLVDMNFSGIEQICRKVNLGESGYVYIMDSKGDIIYHPGQQLIYSGLEIENNELAMSYEDGGYNEKFQNRNRFVTVKTVGYTGWKIVGVSYIDEVTPYREIAFFGIIVIILAIVIMVMLNRYVSSKIARPIKELEESVRDIDRGQLDVTIDVSGSLEVRHLGEAINGMLLQIRSLMDEVVQEQEQKLKSELDALQSQINPHFLYNTLDSIVWMIEKGNYKQAVVMVTAISRLFRIGISRGITIITVQDEIEHSKNYLTIQNIRYKDKFDYQIIIEDEAKNMQTIKLIVQPIIENAIYHGVEFMDGEGMIKIHAYVKDENTFIDISDNGLGMSPDTIERLLAKPNEKSKGSGIGLYNVQKRIQLYFGDEYGLTISSEPDVGTSIQICLPAMQFTNGSCEKTEVFDE